MPTDKDAPFDNNSTVAVTEWMRGRHGKRFAFAVSCSEVRRFFTDKVRQLVMLNRRHGATITIGKHIFGLYCEKRSATVLDVTPYTELFVAYGVHDGK